MRQPEVIITSMAIALIQWVIRTQTGWITRWAGLAGRAGARATSAEPMVMAAKL